VFEEITPCSEEFPNVSDQDTEIGLRPPCAEETAEVIRELKELQLKTPLTETTVEHAPRAGAQIAVWQERARKKLSTNFPPLHAPTNRRTDAQYYRAGPSAATVSTPSLPLFTYDTPRPRPYIQETHNEPINRIDEHKKRLLPETTLSKGATITRPGEIVSPDRTHTKRARGGATRQLSTNKSQPFSANRGTDVLPIGPIVPETLGTETGRRVSQWLQHASFPTNGAVFATAARSTVVLVPDHQTHELLKHRA
jgi:hypothetical protein